MTTITFTVPVWACFVFCGLFVLQTGMNLYVRHLECKIAELKRKIAELEKA